MDFEQHLIGCILIDNKILPDVYSKLKDKDFYSQVNKSIYSEIIKLYTSSLNGNIDIIVLVNNIAEKHQQEKGTVKNILGKYMNDVISASNYSLYVDKIKEKSISIQAKSICANAINELDCDNAIKCVSETVNKLNDISKDNREKTAVYMNEYIVEYYNNLFKPKTEDLFKTGYYNLDRILDGAERGDLTIIAARPGIGKSTLALNIATKLMCKNKKVFYFGLEMSKEQVTGKMLSAISKVPFNYIKNHNVNDYAQDLAKGADILNRYGSNLIVDDISGLTTNDIKLSCMLKGIDVIIIDYLQLITPINSKATRNDQIGEISRNLKIIANELNCWVICLSQLSRDVEKRNGSPILSDLRDSGSIEQDANQVMFLFRENKDDEYSDVVCSVAKNRLGTLGKCIFNFNKPIQQFVSTDREYKEPSKNKKDNYNPEGY